MDTDENSNAERRGRRESRRVFPPPRASALSAPPRFAPSLRFAPSVIRFFGLHTLVASLHKFALANSGFALQSQFMEPKWAEENLQTIRTLMERSAVYRRALAPIMLFAGTLGVLAAAGGLYFQVESPKAFAGFWLGTACVVVVGAFLMARRQARKERELFWSPPTRRVGQALLPPLLSGTFISGLLAVTVANWAMDVPMTLVWILFYGCALHSAGFFMTRSVRWFGWIFITGAIVLSLSLLAANHSAWTATASLIMGFFFGGLHLAYGACLYLTERKNPIA
jgi:hypothetical protein